ncbi:MAG: S-layer homology domain-containing protein [Oscillospiraceae bacterium]|nr:S-layer homology domain-containing protein [Oscillospiraceae bacterium]
MLTTAVINRRTAAFLLAATICISLTFPAEAVFQDVADGQYYAAPVAWAVEQGITNGTTGTSFSPELICSRGEIITFLWRAAGSPEPEGESPYSDVTDPDIYYYSAAAWAAENNMADGDSFAPEAPCTRSMAVEFMWKLAGSPEAADAGFADVPASADYAAAVNWALAENVTTGTSDSTFDPDGICTRAQIVTFLYRAFAESEQTASADAATYATTYEGLIQGETQLVSWHDPEDTSAVDGNIRYMLQHGMNTITFTGSASDVGADINTVYTSRYMDGIKHYEEFGYNKVSSSLTSSYDFVGGITATPTISFSNSYFSDDEAAQYREEALSSAIAVHDRLWASGTITEGMSETQKAKAYYDWIVKNCDYDFSFASTSFIPYGVFHSGKAVCEGYTGAYNLLLKLEGIDCSTEMTADHIWTTATLDGTFCHIDATWGDQNNLPSEQYFAMTPEVSWARFG